MTSQTKQFIEKNFHLIEDHHIDKFLSLADNKLEPNIYNDLIDSLLKANIINTTDKLAKHKVIFDLDELEENIEEDVSYEARVKYMNLTQYILEEKLNFTYCSQEEIDYNDVETIICCLNNFLFDSYKELIGYKVVGAAYCRSTPNETIPIMFNVVDHHIYEYEFEYTYHIAFSVHDDEYAAIEEIIDTIEVYDKAWDRANDLATEQEEELLNEYGEGYILLIKAPKGLNVDALRGEDLMRYVDETWDIWEG